MNADLILFNGQINTVDRENPYASAVAISDGRFVAVGTDAQARQHNAQVDGRQARTVDLGRTNDRLLDPESQGGDVVIGRVIVAPEGRGQKLGHTLMSKALESIEEYWPQMPVFMSAQTYLTPFYERYEFVTVGDPYLEDGIRDC